MNIRNLMTALVLVGAILPVSAGAAYERNDDGMGGGATLSVTGTLETSADAEVSGSSDGDTSTSTQTTTTTTTTTTENGLLQVNALGIPVMSSVQVATDADLTLFRENMQTEDKNIAEVSADSDEKIAVAYWHQGHLFGVFPMKVKSETTVRSETNGSVVVKTRMPWWNMFLTGTGRVTTDVDSSLNESRAVENDFKLAGNATAKARILEAIAEAHLESSGLIAR